jgi:DMSO/TMAO reductase YedYZ heme-binding membrane subunit
MITWIVLRAAGIGAYLMLFGTVAWGLVATTNLGGKKIPRNTATLVHQFLSTAALVLLGVHIGGLLLDRFVPFRPLDILVPFHASFKPVAVAIGIVTMYLMIVVLGSSWLRKRVGTKWWRRFHLLAVPTFSLALIHGVFAGTDTLRPWVWWMYMATGGLVLFLVLVRGLTAGFRPARAERPAHARAAGPRAPARTDGPAPEQTSGRSAPVGAGRR